MRRLTNARRISEGGDGAGACDGRYIDTSLGTLSGEGSHIRSSAPDEAFPVLADTPFGDIPGTERTTYYGLPVLKEPVWRWYIPAYFYLGGLAGATAWTGACAVMMDDPALARTVLRCRRVAVIALAGSAVLLIADLGRPARFINMLRVFRPTSPMNLGTWILSGAGAASGGAWLSSEWGVMPRVGNGLGIAGGVIGLALAGYTAVLLANTAVPIWQRARAPLPVLFMTSSLASIGSLLELFPLSRRERSAVARLSMAGKLTELASEFWIDREVGREPVVRDPLRRGFSGALFRGARVLTALAFALSAMSRRRKRLRVAAGILGTLGAVGVRFAMVAAGRASARDPRATFLPQAKALSIRDERPAGAHELPGVSKRESPRGWTSSS